MKKLMYVCFAVFLGTVAARAQDTSWGVMAGLNASTLEGKDFNLTAPQPGMNLGIFLNHSKKERSGIKAELLYTSLGSQFQNTDNEIRLHYLQIPVYGVAYLNDRSHSFRPKIMVGPYLGFLLDGKGSNTDAYYFTKKNFSPVELGGKGAVGFNWNLGQRIWMNSEVYYGLGFTNAHKTESINIHNSSLGFNVGLSFPLE